jgi:hypothetical protein
VTFAYVGGTNRISTITDTAASPNRTIDFGYDGSNRLTSITAAKVRRCRPDRATGNRRATACSTARQSLGWADGLNTTAPARPAAAISSSRSVAAW